MSYINEFDNFNIDKIQFDDPKIINTGRMVNITYMNKPIYIKLKSSTILSNAYSYKDLKTNYTVEIDLKNNKNSLLLINAIDNHIISKCNTYAMQWIRKRSIELSDVNKIYNYAIKKEYNKTYIKAKIYKYNNQISLTYLGNQNYINDSNIDNLICTNKSATIVLKCKTLYIINNNIGVTWSIESINDVIDINDTNHVTHSLYKQKCIKQPISLFLEDD